MMSGQEYENMAVVGQVADIVHAFKEASSYLKRIKERRKSRPPPRGLVVDSKALQDLEFSLSRGQDAVRGHYERDYRRLGQPFATGDLEAAEQLKEILFKLQRQLVSNLKFAYQHDQHIGFLPLQDIADQCSDSATMALMQLHQRVLMNVDMRDVAGGALSSGRQQAEQSRPQSRSQPNPPRLEAPIFTQELPLPTPEAMLQLPTPEQSPLHEISSYMNAASLSSNNPFKRSKALEIQPGSSRASVNTLPTPPLDKAIGPPPEGPLPPLPKEFQEKRWRTERGRHEETRPELPRKESQSSVDLLERTLREAWDDEEFMARQAPVNNPVEFQEPHPGTPVDPSRIDEHPSSRGLPPPVDIGRFPSPPPPPPQSSSFRARAMMSSSPIRLSPPFLAPPRHMSNDQTTDSLERPSTSSGVMHASDQRFSSVSSATYASHGSSAVSALSRQDSASSGHSWAANSHHNRQVNDAGQVSSSPSNGLTARSKIATVPEAIHEVSTPTDYQIHPRPLEMRRPSAPASSTASRPTLSAFPHVPPPPAPYEPVPRRGSAMSVHSGTSSAASSSAPPTPMPIKTIAPRSMDAADSKAHLPSESNKYGGLCKSAWRSQIGDLKKAYSAEKRPRGIVSGVMVDYMKCKTCNFSGNAVPNAKGKKVPDRKIIVVKNTGVAYRWDFLFKSHLPFKGGAAVTDAEFGCMFCCAEGRGTPVFKGMSNFISHIAEHRPGGTTGSAANTDLHIPEGPVCDRMDALVGRMMEHEDRWEIAFPTASGDGAYSDAASVVRGGPGDGQSVRSGATSRAYY